MIKKEKIKLLIQYLDAGSNMEKDFKGVVDMMNVDVSPEDLATMREAIMQRFHVHHAKYIDEQADVYDKYLDDEVLDASIAFYTSKAGEQVIAKIPLISAEVDQLNCKLKKVVIQDMMNIADEYDTN
jgi:hypothetical protein